ncbi:hypothetical protein MMC30_000789 [Trapelia coarctata]|nr:hypothetical protein [Trapelia coarctata]
MTVCLPASSLVPTGASTVELLKLTNARSLMTVPSTLEEISLLPNQEGIKALLLLQFVAFGGGPLKSSVGENLSAAGVRLLNHYGATEIGPLAPIFVPAMDYDWQYFRLRKDYPLRVEKIPVSEDGTQQYQLIARPFGWETPFESQDRLVTNPKHRMTDFNAVGRNDDVIVLATGEKVLPGILESLLSESDLVKIAIAFGDGQFELGVIVQPAMPLSLADYAQFKSAIWPTILQAGDRMDAHARISSQEAIIVASPEMVFPRSDKGSMMRKEVYKLLEAEIAEAYKRLDNSIIDDSLPLLDMDHVEEELKDMVQYRLNWRIQNHEWTYDDDLFELGMDSLQAVRLRRFILATLPKHARLLPLAERVGRDFVYRHPSITKMATVLRSSDLLNNTAIESQDRIAEYVQQYSLKQPEIRNMGREIGSVVLLTGSTGSLGSYLLAHLAGLPGVARVVCLNRPPQHASQSQDPHERQVQAFRTRGIRVSPEVWSKIQIMQTTSAAPFLGMEDTEYMHLRGQVTHIVHNAFPMDFKMILPSFASQFQTLQNLLQLARDAHAMCSSTRPKILFVSSIAVAGQYPSAYGERVVPEISLDNNCINRLGYAEAKMVCERIIEKAAEEFQNEIDPTFVRVGQLSGSKMSGFWNSDEHMTALMKSSQSIGRLPLIEGVGPDQLKSLSCDFDQTDHGQTLSWLPVDCAAEAISELLLTTRPTDLVYHLENPVRQPWQDALTLIASKLGFSDTDLLPFDDWLDTVSMSAGDENPAKLLIDFFKADFRHMACGNVMLSTENAQKVSSTLREMDVISDATISAYIDRWRSIGFLR